MDNVTKIRNYENEIVVITPCDNKIEEYIELKRRLEASIVTRIVCVGIRKDFEHICHVMYEQRNYNVHIVANESDLTETFLQGVCETEQTRKNMIVITRSRYALLEELVEMLNQLNTTCAEGSADKTKEWLMRNYAKLELAVTALGYIKTELNKFFSVDVDRALQELEQAKEQIQTHEKEMLALGELEAQKEELNEKIKSLNNKLEQAEAYEHKYNQAAEQAKQYLDNLHKKEEENQRIKFENAGLEEKIEKLKKTTEDDNASLSDQEVEAEKLRKKITELENIVTEQEHKINAMKMQVNATTLASDNLLATNGNAVIRRYTTINTTIIQCYPENILYFKEISKVPYINSLIYYLFKYFEEYMDDKRKKLMIYDSDTDVSDIYNPLNVVDTIQYTAKGKAFFDNVNAFVVSEPNSVILTDILTSSAPAHDYIILYDRMKHKNDIVTGNNVHKFYVINSLNDFEKSKVPMGIRTNDNIITRQGTRLNYENVIQIPTFKDYSNGSQSKKLSHYALTETVNGQSLIKTILQKAMVFV